MDVDCTGACSAWELAFVVRQYTATTNILGYITCKSGPKVTLLNSTYGFRHSHARAQREDYRGLRTKHESAMVLEPLTAPPHEACFGIWCTGDRYVPPDEVSATNYVINRTW